MLSACPHYTRVPSASDTLDIHACAFQSAIMALALLSSESAHCAWAKAQGVAALETCQCASSWDEVYANVLPLLLHALPFCQGELKLIIF